jgi:ABC-type transport system involved in multi-copper enzyme maturation permease subunit
MRLVAGMSLRRAWRGRLIWLSLAVLVLLLGSALLALLSGNGGRDFFKGALDMLIRYLVPLLMALHGSAAVSEEVQGKTITYLFSRPIRRWALPMGKYLGSVGLGLVLFCPALVLTYVIAMLGEMELFGADLSRLGMGLVALCLAVLLYGAIATAFGTMASSYSFVLALVYLLVVEVSFSFVPGWFKVISMAVHLRVVAGLYVPKTTLFQADPKLTIPVALVAVGAELLMWLAIAISWVGSSEYRTDK